MVAHSPQDDRVSITDERIAVSTTKAFTMVRFHKERFMKPENKLPVLASISDEMRAVLNVRQDDLPP